jgi:hypothetical protein
MRFCGVKLLYVANKPKAANDICGIKLLYIADIPEKGAGGMLEITARPMQRDLRLQSSSGLAI